MTFLVVNNSYQRIRVVIRQWFEIIQFPTVPIPIPGKARIDGPRHHLLITILGYKNSNQRYKR